MPHPPIPETQRLEEAMKGAEATFLAQLNAQGFIIAQRFTTEDPDVVGYGPVEGPGDLLDDFTVNEVFIAQQRGINLYTVRAEREAVAEYQAQRGGA